MEVAQGLAGLVDGGRVKPFSRLDRTKGKSHSLLPTYDSTGLGASESHSQSFIPSGRSLRLGLQ